MAKTEDQRQTLENTFPTLADQWHPSKNGKLTPSDISPHSEKRVWWQCENGHEWQSSPNSRSRHISKCPFCANKKVWKGYNDLASQYPNIAKEWHPTKNGNLTPDQVVATTTKRYWWKCEHGHEWEAPVRKRTLSGHGCHQCSGQAVIVGENDLRTLHPSIAALFHPVLNQGIELDKLAAKSNKTVWWQCENGYDHPYSRPVYRQVEANGRCPYCSNRRILPGFNDLQHVHPELVSEWDFEKNDKMPWEVTSSSSYKAHWKCEEGHEWTAKVSSRTKNDRLSVCSQCQKNRTSFAEQCVAFYIKKYYGEKIQESVKLIPDRKYEVDIFIPEYDLAIEYNGTYWHRNKFEEDSEKFLLLSQQGITVIYILEPNGQKITGSKYFAMKTEAIKELEEACKWALSNIPNIDLEIVDINILRDRLDIARSYRVKDMSSQFSRDFPEFLEMWDYAKNNKSHIYPYLLDKTSKDKVSWQCPKCHARWNGSIMQMRQDDSCPHCGVSSRQIYEQHSYMSAQQSLSIDHDADYSLAARLPNIADMWDARKNFPMVPEVVPYMSKDTYWWICEEGHSWNATIKDIEDGKVRCPYCAGEKQYNVLSFARPDVAATWHPNKNGDVTPDDVTCGSNRKYWWLCDKGHTYRAQVNVRCMDGYKCAICSGQQVDSRVNSLSAIRPDVAQYWDYDKNGDLTPDEVTVGSTRVVWWLCENGCERHSYEKSVRQMTVAKDHFCPYCSNTKLLTGYNDLATRSPNIAKQWDYEKNKGVIPEEVLFCSTTRRHWKCELCGKEWTATPGSRVSRQGGCPRCANQDNVKNAIAREKAENYVPSLVERICENPQVIIEATDCELKKICYDLGLDDESLRIKYLYYDMSERDIADEVYVTEDVIACLLKRLCIPDKTRKIINKIREEVQAYDQKCLERIGHNAAWLVEQRIIAKKTVPAIASEYGISKSVLNRLVYHLHISKKKRVTAREELARCGIDRAWLVEEHCNKQRSYLSIEAETGFTDMKIAEACMQYRIPYLGYARKEE